MTETLLDIPEETPASITQLCQMLGDSGALDEGAVYPVGGRTSLQFLGPRAAPGKMVCTSRLNQLIDYPARDMTITVESGTKISDLKRILGEQNQQLPIDLCHEHRATIGGVIACNVSGPRRFGYGTLRDYVIGLSTVDSEGRLFKAGGRVVKNVAGYDLCKLMVGSRGTLGVIAQVTLKVLPASEGLQAVWCSCDSFHGIDLLVESLLKSETRPVALEVLTESAAKFIVADARVSFPTDKPVLLVFYEGTHEEINWQIGRVRDEMDPSAFSSIEEVSLEDSELLLGTLREFPDGGDVPVTFQANLLPSKTMKFLSLCEEQEVSAIAHAGNGIVIGHLSEEVDSREQIESILAELTLSANTLGGNLILLDAKIPSANELNWWGREEPSWSLMGDVRQALDPLGRFSPGAVPFPVRKA